MARERGTKEEIADKKQQFGMWLGLPKEAREPKTQEALAKQLGTFTETLTKWKRDDIVKKAKDSALKLFYGSGEKMAIFMTSIEDGLKKNAPATQRLYAEMIGLVGSQEKGKQEPVEIIIKSGKKDRS